MIMKDSCVNGMIKEPSTCVSFYYKKTPSPVLSLKGRGSHTSHTPNFPLYLPYFSVIILKTLKKSQSMKDKES